MSELLAPETIALALGKLITRAGPLATTIGGKIGLFVPGRNGRFEIDLDVPGGRVRRVADGERCDVDTLIAASPRAFSAMWSEPGAVQTYAELGELKVVGDRSKLVRLAALIGQGGGLVALRARSGRKSRRTR